MKNIGRYLFAGVMITTLSQIACKKDEDVDWSAAYLIINSSPCELDSKNEFNGKLQVKVEAEDKHMPFRERGSESFTFDRSHDLDPGLGVKFPIQLPEKKYAYTLSTTWSTPRCESCSACNAKCDNGPSHMFATTMSYTRNHPDENEITMFLTEQDPADICLCDDFACRTGGDTGGVSSTGGSSAGGTSGGSSAGGEGGRSDGGSTSEGGNGGQSESGGAASGGGGEAGAGGSVSVDPICGEDMVVVGQYATWCGLVNEHQTDDGTWVPDSDCSSGCYSNTVSYCQKFWPTSTTQVQLETPSSDIKVFKDAGCRNAYSGTGLAQYACCAPR